MLRTASSLLLTGLLTLGFRPHPFPGDTASLLPGFLTGSCPDRTLTGRRRRAYEHEETPSHYVTVSPPALLGARNKLTAYANVLSAEFALGGLR